LSILKKRIDSIGSLIGGWCKKKLVLPWVFCPSGQLGKRTHFAGISKIHWFTHRPKYAKECVYPIS